MRKGKVPVSVYYWLPLCLWIAVIFSLSSQSYYRQDLKPWINDNVPKAKVKEHLSGVEFRYGGREISIDANGVTGFVEFLIRKGAHVLEYAVFGYLLIRVIYYYMREIGMIPAAAVSVAFSFVYAGSDELHQMFVASRTANMADVWLDMAGSFLGIVLYLSVKAVSQSSEQRQ